MQWCNAKSKQCVVNKRVNPGKVGTAITDKRLETYLEIGELEGWFR